MLKLKDNVDLKELEKFGFLYSDYYDAYVRTMNLQLYSVTIRVFVDNPNYKKGEVTAESSVWYDLIFSDDRMSFLNKDLIQAGLVEKVKNDN